MARPHDQPRKQGKKRGRGSGGRGDNQSRDGIHGLGTLCQLFNVVILK